MPSLLATWMQGLEAGICAAKLAVHFSTCALDFSPQNNAGEGANLNFDTQLDAFIVFW